MDTRHIQAVIAVQRHGSFTGAARALFVSQSTLSRQVAALERELGGPFFVRRPRRVELTPLGRAFLPVAQEVLETVARAQEAARAGRDRPCLEHQDEEGDVPLSAQRRGLGLAAV